MQAFVILGGSCLFPLVLMVSHGSMYVLAWSEQVHNNAMHWFNIRPVHRVWVLGEGLECLYSGFIGNGKVDRASNETILMNVAMNCYRAFKVPARVDFNIWFERSF